MPLTPEAKRLLAETIRGSAQDPAKGVRARLLRSIHDEADRRYRLSVPIAEAGLEEAHRRGRERIEAWVDERARATKPKTKTEWTAAKDRLLAQAEKEAAATLVNRLVLLRHLEVLGLSKPAVLTGGWSSKGYREFRQFAPTLCTNGTTDATEGYATLLQLLFDELAVDLPGLFGDVGLTRLFAIPAATLREVVERFDDSGLVSAWTDDTTLGWVYQYWTDFERDALDAKALDGGKIEPHEIASKTQMFTDRYIVEWLLQNSLGFTWLAMCKKRGWAAEAEHILKLLDDRRSEWRKKREANEVALDALMPIGGELEEHWKYYVPQPVPDDAVTKAPESVRSIKVLDPACGSGHFLVIAFDLLAALYREEARHLKIEVTDKEIAESILENNLHGIDIDPRAIQIAAAGLYLKARSFAKSARPKSLNLVAPVLQLGNLPVDDPAVVELRNDLTREVGIPTDLTTKLLSGLAGVDYLGSLLKVHGAIEDAIKTVEQELERAHGQGNLFRGFPPQQVRLSLGEAKASILDRLERFLAKHSKSEDLGLRLDGEQVAAGVRFVRIAKDGAYDLVVGNPPYQGVTKTNAFGYVTTTYPKGKADLCTAFLERAVELTKPGGLAAMVAMRAWMFLGQFAELRRHFHHAVDLRTLGDLDRGAFESMPTSQLISVAMTIMRNAPRTSSSSSIALQPTAPGEKFWGPDRTNLKRAAILVQRGRYEFDPGGFKVIEGEPIVYWWSKAFLAKYAAAPKLGNVSPARFGLTTGDNTRFVRLWHEIKAVNLGDQWGTEIQRLRDREWVPFVLGGKGRAWVEPLREVCRWRGNGLEVKEKCVSQYGTASKQVRNEDVYFRPGIAFAMIGATFSGRIHRYPSVIGNMGSSVYPNGELAPTLALMNGATAKFVLQSINPGLHFEVGDVNRLPVVPVPDAHLVTERIVTACDEHESAREPSIEFRGPGRSAWQWTQQWAEAAINRSEGAVLPPFEPSYDHPAPESFVSFAIGVALGRFGAKGEGVLETAPPNALPTGILFISSERADDLEHAACKPINDAWEAFGTTVGEGDDLRTFLRKSFFAYHRKLYENRPIYLPLSSAKKNFVALVSVHRWAEAALSVLLADHLVPTKRRLEGELDDLRTARVTGTNNAKAEKRFAEVQKLLEELNDFIAKVTEIAEKGPPPPDDKTTKREIDIRYVMDLDDGVMVNSAALWPLLEPQWKDPKKWWKELANAQGKKDYDWAHLAARYFPTRVRRKCHEDPSVAVAHKCFWELHPAKAYAWELRLQDEIRSDFTIDEPGSNEARTKFLQEHEREAREILAKELKRRERKSVKEDDGDAGPLFHELEEQDAEQTDA